MMHDLAANLANALLILPAGCSVLTGLLGRKHDLQAENRIAKTCFVTAWLLVVCVTILTVLWFIQGRTEHVLVQDIFGQIDSVSIGFLLMTAYATLITIKFSRYYLHREQGYSRFFAVIFLFVFGMNFLTLSGSMQDLLIGWEIAGLSSFLLIAFYHERELPVRHALRAFAVYRVTDAALLLATVWLNSVASQHVEHLPLPLLGTSSAGDPALGLDPWSITLVGLLLVIAAAGKGAQWPFSTWLPRAMEGPTPSSAIFYGALSIHAGMLLLMRTTGLWMPLLPVRIMLGVIGLLSAVYATGIGRIQSNIKGQIAYASITQVGIMMIELALGLPRALVLIHVCGNAALRTYQLLASPSVVAHMLQMQTTRAAVGHHRWSVESWLPKRFRLSLYAFALNEGFLDYNLRYVGLMSWWSRLTRPVRVSLSAAVALGLIAGSFLSLYGAGMLDRIEASVLIFAMLFAAVLGRNIRLQANRRWLAIALSQISFGLLTIVLVHPEKQTAGLYFLTGVVPAALVGAGVLSWLQKNPLAPLRDHGFFFPNVVIILLIATLALSAFPVTQACWGEEMLLGDLWLRLPILTAICIVTLVVNGFTLMQIFAQRCFGRKLITQSI